MKQAEKEAARGTDAFWGVVRGALGNLLICLGVVFVSRRNNCVAT